MNNFYNNGFNPMGNNVYPNYGVNAFQQNNFPKMEVIRVNGRNGAEAFQIAANSSALLLDTTDNIVWFVQTDGAGYKTISPFTITPYQPKPVVDVNSLEQRIKALEDRLNGKHDTGTDGKE